MKKRRSSLGEALIYQGINGERRGNLRAGYALKNAMSSAQYLRMTQKNRWSSTKPLLFAYLGVTGFDKR